jgi:hypothetical protein
MKKGGEARPPSHAVAPFLERFSCVAREIRLRREEDTAGPYVEQQQPAMAES